MIGLLSRDPLIRRDTVRALIRRRAVDLGVSQAALSRVVSIQGTRWKRIMQDGQRACPPLCDLAVLSEVLGVEMLDAFARELGHRVVPDAKGIAQAPDVLAAAAGVMADTAKVIGQVTAAIGDGAVTPSEASQIDALCDELRRRLSGLQAQVAAAVVTPIKVVP